MSEVPKNLKWFTYEYYDTPQGNDIARKMFWTTTYCVPTHLLYTALDIIMYTKIRKFGPGIARAISLSVPFIVTPLTAVSVSNISASIRSKDDHLNYALGGFMSGKLLGIWFQSPGHGTFLGVVFAICGVVRKHLLDIGYYFEEPEPMKVETRSVLFNKLDFTLREHRPGNWSRE